MTTIGIDIGGSSVKVAALRDGRRLWVGQSSTYTRPNPDAIAAAVREAIAGRLDGPPAAVGLCVPGILDERKERVVLSVNVPGLNGIRLTDLVAQAVGPPGHLTVANDSNATARDLYTAGGLAGRLLALVLGTGVGASVVDERGFLSVDGDSPGHFGQMDVSIESHPVIGPDGGAGSLEGYVGSAALAARYGPAPAAAFLAMRSDDPPVRALARAVRIGHALYRPHHVCLAGGTGIRLGHLLPGLRRLVETELTSIARPGWTLAVGDDDFHAAAGAARLAGA